MPTPQGSTASQGSHSPMCQAGQSGCTPPAAMAAASAPDEHTKPPHSFRFSPASVLPPVRSARLSFICALASQGEASATQVGAPA